MLKTRSGFTIVELLIVIVVIAILAAISIVAYNGIQERAKFSSMRSDIASLNKAIQLYYADNGSYPITPPDNTETVPSCSKYGRWCGWDQATGDNFIPGLVPKYISATPQLPSANGAGDTYVYRSPNGLDYRLIRIGVSLSSNELSSFSDLRPNCSGTQQTDRWGMSSSVTSQCW